MWEKEAFYYEKLYRQMAAGDLSYRSQRAVLCPLRSIFSGDKPTVPDNPAQAEPAEPAGPKPDEPATDDADKPKTVYNEFPRKPSVYENMAAQNVGGLGKEQLFEVYDSSDGYYLFSTARPTATT